MRKAPANAMMNFFVSEENRKNFLIIIDFNKDLFYS